MQSNLDDIAAKLPQIEFKAKKKHGEYYNQNMQSLRGGRQFILRTSPPDINNIVKIRLTEYGTRPDQWFVIAERKAIFNDADSFHSALKSLERKAKCKLYYVLLISTDGEYL